MAAGKSSVGSENKIVPECRYIPLPQDVWRLQKRYPSVLKFVLLECRRCCQWVPVEVTTAIPNEIQDAPFVGPPRLVNASTVEKQAMRNEETIWHSPRLRAKKEAVLSTTQSSENDISSPPASTSLYIPNPAHFVCTSSMCQKGDRLLRARSEWLRSLYDAWENEEGKKGFSERGTEEGKKELKEAVAASVRKALDIRRSERLAARKRKREDASETKGKIEENSPSSPNSFSSLVSRLSKQMLHGENTLSSCFCWVMCELCGKLRRTAQPFPGGAPFVCSLSPIGSCKVSQRDGLTRYTEMYTSAMLTRIGLTAPVASFSPGNILSRDTSRSEWEDVHAMYQHEPVVREIRAGWCDVAAETQSVVDLVDLLPTLKDLTMTLRRKSLNSFVKKVVFNPEEIRQKREDVLRALFLSDCVEETNKDLGQEGSLNSDLRGADGNLSNEESLLINKCVKKEEEDIQVSAGAPLTRRRRRSNMSEVTGEELASGGAAPSPPGVVAKRRGRQPKVLSTEQTKEVKTEVKAENIPKKRGRGRPPKESDCSVIFWIQCDKCNKWRIVPEQQTPETWECSRREGTTCEDSADEE